VPKPGAWWCSATTHGPGQREGCQAVRGPCAAAAGEREAAPCTTTVRSIDAFLKLLAASSVLRFHTFVCVFRRERRRVVARGQGGRGRRGGRVDQRHVGGDGLRYARRLGVALACYRGFSCYRVGAERAS
jgi:hypothetical protein